MKAVGNDMASTKIIRAVLDRAEEPVAVFLDEDDRVIKLPLARVEDAREGAFYLVEYENEEPVSARPDPEADGARRAHISSLLDKFKKQGS